MNSCLFTFQSPVPTNCFEQLVYVLNGLLHVIGYRRQHDWTVLRIAEALTARIHRVRRRLLALIAAIRAGKALPQGARGAAGRVDPKAAERRLRRREIWHGITFRYGWLCPLLPVDAATLGGYLNQVLQDPEMRAMMASDPRIAKLLRPFVKMLAGDARLLEVAPEDGAAVVAVSGGGEAPEGAAGPETGPPGARGAFIAEKEFSGLA